MSASLLVIIMGSRADEAHAVKVAEEAARLGLDSVLRVGSAHKTPAALLELLAAYEADPRPKVYVAIAGRSNALGGFVDGAVSAAVINCPPPAESFGGADLWSSLRMPSGIAPAFVMEAANAALLAAKILAPFDEDVKARLSASRRAKIEEILRADEALSEWSGVEGGKDAART
jgi:phosphoribosylaminoimidazole carboxylase PurE protein